MSEKLREQIATKGATLEVLGVATTGYAKDILKDVLNADVALVETVAHTESALKFYDDPHVIVDVGGQDIKLIVLQDGRVKDFKLNTQCSAGNGYFLQSTAEGFGIKVDELPTSPSLPSLCRRSAMDAPYSCSLISSTSSARAGGQKKSSQVSPMFFLRMSSSMSQAFLISQLWHTFRPAGWYTEQPCRSQGGGGLHQIQFRANGREPEIIVHEHCGESGAIGAAQEALRLGAMDVRPHSSDSRLSRISVIAPRVTKTHAATSARTIACAPLSTSMYRGKQATTRAQPRGRRRPRRTVEEVGRSCSEPAVTSKSTPTSRRRSHGSCSSGGHASLRIQSKEELLVQIQLTPGSSKIVELPKPLNFNRARPRFPCGWESATIIATCEKGGVEDLDEMKDIRADIDEVKAINPNYVDIAASDVFRQRDVRSSPTRCHRPRVFSFRRRQKSVRSHDAAQRLPRRNSPPLEHLHLRTVLQRILRQPRPQV